MTAPVPAPVPEPAPETALTLLKDVDPRLTIPAGGDAKGSVVVHVSVGVGVEAGR